MWITTLLIGLSFIVVIVMVISEKINRAIASLMGGLVCFFVLTIFEKTDAFTIVSFLFGSAADDFSNLRSIILILGMLIIVEICSEGGLFQFLAFKMIQLTKGKPVPLLIMFCIMAMLIGAILNNLLSVLIVIPLVITICRILNVSPRIYILTCGIVVNQGATIFVISSIPNILIANHVGISFTEYFVQIGLITIVVFSLTILLWLTFIPKKLTPSKSGIDILLEFNVWMFIPNRKLMAKSSFVLITVMILFVVIPSEVLSPDIIAITGAVFLLLISGLEIENFVKRIDFELILYVLGIFIVTGALEHVGIIDSIGNWINNFGPTEVYAKFVFILWISAFISTTVDNIPMTQVLMPIVDIMTEGYPLAERKFLFNALIFGVNWGDNLTPMGDNVLMMKIAENHNQPVKIREFFILGFFTTCYQLFLLTVFFGLIYQPILWISILSIAIGIGLLIYLIRRKKNNKVEDQVPG